MPSKLGQQMNTLIRGEQPQPTVGQEKATTIRSLYKQGLQELRGARNMHPERRRVEIAQLYATTQQALRKVLHDQIEADRETFTKLERSLWGFDDVRASAVGSAERAAVDGGIRDAQDRAAKLTKREQAARALAEAEQAGDTVLARAVAKRAHDMDWDDLVADYLSTRPAAAEKYQQAAEIWTRQNTPDGVLAQQHITALGKPEELHGLHEKDIQAMADPGDAAA
ncbi:MULTISPECIES: hypothetical protein [unclassified Streptomyces]|uniref:hypothetical protein n=1 Tax=unclassified Streptomyces TaxID=2593676 RepID=UPI0036F6F33A